MEYNFSKIFNIIAGTSTRALINRRASTRNLVLQVVQANIEDGKETITSSNNLDLEKKL